MGLIRYAKVRGGVSILACGKTSGATFWGGDAEEHGPGEFGMGDGATDPRPRTCARWIRFTFALVAAFAACLSLNIGNTSAQEWAPPRTVFVEETGHTTDGLFLNLWRDERALLGDPVTEEFKPRSGFSTVHGADTIQYYKHLALVYLPDGPLKTRCKRWTSAARRLTRPARQASRTRSAVHWSAPSARRREPAA